MLKTLLKSEYKHCHKHKNIRIHGVCILESHIDMLVTPRLEPPNSLPLLLL